MDNNRYDIFKIRLERRYTIYVDVDSINDIYEFSKLMLLSKYTPKSSIDYVLQKKQLRIDEKYLFQIAPDCDNYTIQNYGKFTINSNRDIIISFNNEKQLALKILGICLPNYKPKKIKRVI